ncbi:MAG: hypothetical protein ACI87E_004494, partial [Mariniblastus sp.]
QATQEGSPSRTHSGYQRWRLTANYLPLNQQAITRCITILVFGSLNQQAHQRG